MDSYFVYKHISPSGKVYIGITKQTPNGRWRNGLGYVSSPHFWSAIQKYGWNNIQHEILFSNLTCDEACSKEKELIKYYNSTDRRFGYNEKTGGESGSIYNERARKKISESLKLYYATHPEKVAEIAARVTGFKHSEETKAKMSELKKGVSIAHTDEWKKRISESNKSRLMSDKELYDDAVRRCRQNGQKVAKAVVQLSLDGEFVAQFVSAHEAQRNTGIRNGNISRCCNGHTKSSGGYKWQYADDYNSSRETG